ncbi:MAG: flagellar hook protein FlgE [Thermodesulfobacteriota bacterium]
MLTSLQTAVSGMNASGTELSVIADNIANMNTVGYKKSNVSFGDVLSASVTGVAGAAQVGRGVYVQEVSPLFTQGSLETSENSLDMAIDGDGFFVVSENGANYYTRAGSFSIDQDGYIVTPADLRLQGYVADAVGNLTGTIGDLRLIATQSPANPTGDAAISVNLDGRAAVQTSAFTLDENGDGIADDPANYNSSTTLTMYDSQGGPHQVTLYYAKTAANTWQAHYVYGDPANAGELIEANDGAATPAAVVTTLAFDTAGNLTSATSTNPQFDFGGGVTQNQVIDFDHTASMQYSSEFAVLAIDQDGYASGALESLTISGAGEMTGIFTNGQTRLIGQIALAKFNAPTELVKLGGNLYGESTDSGQPVVSAPGTSGLGDIASNTLELSNVDLAQEFVNMISAQRGFQANSRIITTTDELLAEVVNLKR